MHGALGAVPPLGAAILLAALLAAGLRAWGSSETMGRVARSTVWLAIGLAIGAVASLGWAQTQERARAALSHTSLSRATFVVAGDASIGERGISFSGRMDAGGRGPAVLARVTAQKEFAPGTAFRVIGRSKALEGDWGKSRFMRGEVAAVSAVRVKEVPDAVAMNPIMALRRALIAAIDPASGEAQALIAGILCGRTTELARTEANDACARAGLSHLVAVSGSHLALLAALTGVALDRLSLPAVARDVMLLLLMAAYVVFSGGAPSAVRSCLMVGFTMVARRGQRRAHPLSALLLTVMWLVALSPSIVYDLGFQLSAMSVLFILVFGSYGTYLLQRLRLPEWVAAGLAMTLCAQAATLPITAPLFHELSLVAPLANIVVGPVMNALLVVSMVLAPALLVIPSVAMGIPLAIARSSLFLARLFAGLPLASIPLEAPLLVLCGLYAIAGLLFALWRDWDRRELVLGCVLLSIAAGGWYVRQRFAAPARVVVMDVGQADSILVQQGASTLLVDAGVDEEVVAALARNGVMHIDTVVITHWDRDHWGGLPALLDAVEIERVVVAEGAAGKLPAELRDDLDGRVMQLSEGDMLAVGDYRCQMVWPFEPVAGTENGDSLCLDVRYRGAAGTFSMLLTGDTEVDEEHRYAPDVGDVDVLKVGHHGSKVPVDAEVMDALQPEIAVASAGAGNRYGHPSAEARDAAEAGGARFLCTIDRGDISFAPQRDGFRMRTQR